MSEATFPLHDYGFASARDPSFSPIASNLRRARLPHIRSYTSSTGSLPGASLDLPNP